MLCWESSCRTGSCLSRGSGAIIPSEWFPAERGGEHAVSLGSDIGGCQVPISILHWWIGHALKACLCNKTFPSFFNRTCKTKIPIICKQTVNSLSSSSLFEDDNFFETAKASCKPLKPQVPSEEEDEEEVVCICIFPLLLNCFRH